MNTDINHQARVSELELWERKLMEWCWYDSVYNDKIILILDNNNATKDLINIIICSKGKLPLGLLPVSSNTTTKI